MTHKTLDQGQIKIDRICQVLREETLIPAQDEAREIVEKAQNQARRLLEKARGEIEALEAEAHQRIEQERRVFESSLAQASRQGLEVIRQAIEERLLHADLKKKIAAATSDPKVIAKLIDAIIAALRKDGMATHLSALIPATVDARAVNELLAQETLAALEVGGVVLDGFGGGVQLVLKDQKMTVDVSDEAILELLGRFLRKDFRDLLFRECG